MNKCFIVFFLLITSFSVSLGQNYSSFDRHFTWNPDSSMVFSKPSADADTLSALPYGTEVKVLERLRQIKSSVLIGNIELAPEDTLSDDGYYLPGYWVKVRTTDKKIQGYVFSGEVINFPPLKPDGEGYGRALKDYSSYFGTDIKAKESKKPVELDGESYNEYETLVQFPEGSYRKTDLFDGCFDSEYHFRDKSMAQVYFLFITYYFSLEKNVPGASSGRPEFDYAEGAKLNFVAPGNTPADGLFIDVDDEGKITFGDYYCT